MSKSIIDPYIGIEFEFNKLMSYQGLIDSLNNNESFLELEIGDPKTLKWDYDFLMTVMQLISNKHSYELEKINGFSYFWLAFDYIYEATTYALVNNKKQVGQTEMLNTFKYWDYLPFELRLDILDDLFIQENIDYENHPFQLSAPRKKEKFQKIIPFKILQKRTD